MNARLAEKLDPEEARAILALNLARNLLGLPALAIDLRLCEAAREHSQDMERLKFFSHESPVPGKKSFGDRAKLAGTTASAENIYAGAKSGKSAHAGWFHSPGHHKNQMGNSSRVVSAAAAPISHRCSEADRRGRMSEIERRRRTILPPDPPSA